MFLKKHFAYFGLCTVSMITLGCVSGFAADAPASSCVSSDPEHQCIGLKVVAYNDSKGAPTMTKDQAIAVTEQMNGIWKDCNIGFQVDDYSAVNPADKGLAFGAEAQNQATDIRKAYADDKTFLVAVTGPWDGNYLAWTAMPGSGPYGCVVRQDYANPEIIAHELGHYMGLDHDDDSGNLMYPYPEKESVRSDQCQAARKTDLDSWKAMLRK